MLFHATDSRCMMIEIVVHNVAGVDPDSSLKFAMQKFRDGHILQFLSLLYCNFKVCYAEIQGWTYIAILKLCVM